MSKPKHRAEVAHHSKGRIRLKVPAAKGDLASLETIRSALSVLPGVHQVTVNETTGSVVLLYDDGHHADFEQFLASAPSQEHVEVCPKLDDLSHIDTLLEDEARFLAGHSHTAEVLLDACRSIDREVKRATGNMVDLKVIVPLGLAAAAFLELGVTAATPVWLTLGLFSFNHFVEMHTLHAPKTKPGDPPPAQDQQR